MAEQISLSCLYVCMSVCMSTLRGRRTKEEPTHFFWWEVGLGLLCTYMQIAYRVSDSQAPLDLFRNRCQGSLHPTGPSIRLAAVARGESTGPWPLASARVQTLVFRRHRGPRVGTPLITVFLSIAVIACWVHPCTNTSPRNHREGSRVTSEWGLESRKSKEEYLIPIPPACLPACRLPNPNFASLSGKKSFFFWKYPPP